MGANISSISQWATGRLSSEPEVKIAMYGLDAAGKTTILYRLLGQQDFEHVPTISYNIETVRHQNTDLSLRELGGQAKIRPLWKCWSGWGAQAIIFVVDCTDHERIDEARDELHNNVFNEHWPVVANIESCALLVFANKQDLPKALSSAEVVDKLGMRKVENRWHVQPSCATTGEGLLEGLDWIKQNVEKRR